ncbi:MAG: glucohydrolase, partial [Flavobacteriaceae bacterium]
KAIHRQSRDNARTPMQWDASPNAGFSNAKPWLAVNPNYSEINVAKAEQNPLSILHYYRKMIAFRKAHPTLIYGSFTDLAPNHPQLYTYEREDAICRFLIVHNLGNTELEWTCENSDYIFCMGNYAKQTKNKLQAWESRIYHLDIT